MIYPRGLLWRKLTVSRAKATLDTSRERLSRTKIYSPLNGTVKEKKVSVGDYVRNGSPLLQLIKIDPLKLNFTISEKDIAGLKIGQEVVFTVDSFPGKKFKGKVNLLYPNVEERTRTLAGGSHCSQCQSFIETGILCSELLFTQGRRAMLLSLL
ncbi:MAG: efflux RND transporter periplasmic adaptor subunit [Desulfobacterales bacterium]|nr:efflux RND transporter periplasmic adaptor subunit [Desulfobacterales bacterium]